MISAVEPDWIEQVRVLVQTDDYFQDLKTKWDAGILDPKVYQQKNVIFYYTNRILLSPSSPLN